MPPIQEYCLWLGVGVVRLGLAQATVPTESTLLAGVFLTTHYSIKVFA